MGETIPRACKTLFFPRQAPGGLFAAWGIRWQHEQGELRPCQEPLEEHPVPPQRGRGGSGMLFWSQEGAGGPELLLAAVLGLWDGL